jgi:hypothetical protein
MYTTNDVGARKRRSTGQELLPLQEERIYKVRRNRKMVSLISFDVKGAYRHRE